MDRRFFLALVLTGLVLVVTPLFFPHAPPLPGAPSSDSTVTRSTAPPALPPIASPSVAPPASAAAPVGAAPSVAAETLTVATSLGTYAFSTAGAEPVSVELLQYRALHTRAGNVMLRHSGEALLRFTLVTAHDTIPLHQMAFRAERGTARDGSPTLAFSGTRGPLSIAVSYRFARDDYVASATVAVTGAEQPAFLLVDLPHGFNTQETDTLDDFRHLSYAVKPVRSGARGTPFSKLDPGEARLEPGPLSWAVAKNKYFLVGLLAPERGTPFAEAHLVGGARDSRIPTRGSATVVMPLPATGASFEVYAGPQSWPRLHAMGREFETANPYGGFLQPVVQPFATIVVRLMLWLKEQVKLDYGWVLVVFGIAIRILMWPLNQSAMRSSLKLQRVQPELQAVQARYKGDPAKQQQEIMRVYREHGMSPFSAFSGCLPALIPMPIFFALFFVFQNTIEFRGVPFLWLHDISLRDPFYVLPILTAASMFVMSWIGMRNAPPNPQAKMMLYLMPGMFLVFLVNTAAGLSIYYFVQNLAAIPQQWLIANERARAKPATP